MKCLLGSLFKKEGDRKQDRAGQDRTPASFVESESSRCRICGDALPLCLLYTMGAVPKDGIAEAPGCCVLSGPTEFTRQSQGTDCGLQVLQVPSPCAHQSPQFPRTKIRDTERVWMSHS